MNRTDLRVESTIRLVMRASTAIQVANIKRESIKEKPDNVGVDMGNIVWFGAVEAITALHAKNWINVPDPATAFALFKQYLKEIGDPTHIIVLKESPLKQLVIGDIIAQRERLYGEDDPLRRTYPDNMSRFYEEWSMEALREEQSRLRTESLSEVAELV